MTDTPPYGLTDEELDELNEYFANHPGPFEFGLDAAHGLLSAVVVAPEPIAASEWLPLLIEADDGFGDSNEANRVLALIVRLYNSVVQELESFTYQPIFSETDSEEGGTRLTPKGWCEGFAAGIDLRSEIWGKRLGTDPRLLEIMDPIIRLSAEEGVLDVDMDDGESEPEVELLPGEQPLHESDDLVASEPEDEEASARGESAAETESEAPAHPMLHLLEPMSEPDYDAALNAVAAAVGDIQQYWRDFRPGENESFEEVPKLIRRKRGGQWVH